MNEAEAGILNTCPHTINMRRPDGSFLNVPASGITLRLNTAEEYGPDVAGIPCATVHYTTLVACRDGQTVPAMSVLGGVRVLIVSMPVGEAIKSGRIAFPSGFAVVGPDMGPKHGIRDANGQPTGSDLFICYQR